MQFTADISLRRELPISSGDPIGDPVSNFRPNSYALLDSNADKTTTVDVKFMSQAVVAVWHLTENR